MPRRAVAFRWEDGKMQERGEKSSQQNSEGEVEGLPVIRPHVAGIDLGSNEHWVCAPQVDGSGREGEKFGAPRPELERMLECLKTSPAESASCKSTRLNR